jgi:uncharacterized protein YqeY
MSLSKKIDSDYIEAYKAKATVKVAVLRHLKTAIKNRMVEEKFQELPDEMVLDLIAKQVKQRKSLRAISPSSCPKRNCPTP